MQVNNNGDITFEAPLGTFTPESFPLDNGLQLIAPFWADVDIFDGRGRVWYREASSDSALLMRARNEIRMAFVNHMTFQPTFLFIATWDHVGWFIRFSSDPNRLVSRECPDCVMWQ